MSTDLNLLTLSARALLELMRAGEVSPVEVVQAHLDRIALVNPAINAVVTLRGDEALEQARRAERAYRQGGARALEALPITVKDTIETAGVWTTAGSKILADNIPAADAPAVERLLSAGAILLGKTNTPEFAMTFSTDNLLFGRTLNPRDGALSAGGSSGGEAAIIAAGGSVAGLGSDLAGSIRIPANFCGIVGLRPTVGRVPSTGHIPALSAPIGPLSVIGPLTRRVEDIDLLMRVLAPDWRTEDLKVDHPTAFFVRTRDVPAAIEVGAGVRSAAESLAEGAANFAEEVEPPGLGELFDLWDEVWNAAGGAKGLLSGYPLEGAQLSRGLSALVDASPALDPKRLDRLMIRVQEIRAEILSMMESHPVVVCPVAAGPPTERAGRWTIEGVDLRGARGFAYAYGWSLIGFPAIAVPWSGGGVQIVARPGHDEEAVAAAMRLQGSQA